MAADAANGGRARVLEQKLRVPRMPVSAVPRTRLLREIESAESAGRAVTLVSAPAGAGKTMLLAQQFRKLRLDGVPVAWLSLDEHDNDPFVLWSGVLRACGRAVRGVDSAAEVRLGALKSPVDAGNSGFLSAFVHAVDELREPLWIVIDDVHEITSEQGLLGLGGLIRYRPAGVRIVLGSRFDPPLPLARLMLDGQAGELRAADLAFDRAEAGRLLSAHGLRLANADLTLLMERTEGWAAGLRLAALSLSSQADVTTYIAGFAGDERPLADYLVAEVLAALSDDTVDLLLTTAVAETLTADLASRLTGRADAGAVLAQLARDNALVYRVGSPASYRVHGLLRSFLLAEGSRRDLEAQRRHHVVASRWFADHSMPGLALDHAALGRDWRRVSELLNQHGLVLLLSGDSARLTRAVRELPPELLAVPSTALIAALAALEDGALATARRLIDRVGRDPASHREPRLQLLHTTALMYEARLRGDRSDRLTELIDRSDLRVPAEPDLQLLAAVNRGVLRLWFRDYDLGEADLEAALRMARRDGRDALALDCLTYLAVSAAAAGRDIATIIRRTQVAIDFATERGWSSTARMAPVYLLAAGGAWERLDTAETTRYLTLVAAIDADLEPEVELSARLLGACVAAEEVSNRRDAVRLLRRAWPDDDPKVLPVSASFFCMTELQVALSAGDRIAAAEVLGRAEQLLGAAGDVMVMRAMVHAHDGRKAAARTALAPVLTDAVACHAVSAQISAWLLAAHFAAELDEPARAHEALVNALALAAPRRMLREFAAASGRVRSLLIHGEGRFGEHDAFARGAVAAMTGDDGTADRSGMVAGEALTARELELLRDLPSLLSLEEIAGAHVLSVNTVKTHLKAIYRKFDVGSRRQAVDRARELGLL
ncbi:LuxR C-terminal-related transcriptional regulator [Jiangella asiatica]|uniref:HTH luxR-type domain-containing protein n=1 Tax=Jiangella asiatica TaxID=2530372 RepID=A0A4R5CS47_9ACTN|nr:LuxR C-terminal-related transcriptional regulator [Jiangella asiatica]TDE03392.1 hypothetical protein E1269_20345 [Jiangella asiatica]